MAWSGRGAAGGALSGMLGFSEALRRNMEYRKELEKQNIQQQQFAETMKMARYKATTDTMMQAEMLSQRARQWTDEKARDTAKLEFEREKLRQERKMFEEMLPIKQEEAKYMGIVAGSRVTAADAAATKAKAYAQAMPEKGKGSLTLPGLMREFTASYDAAAKQYMDSKNLTFTQVVGTAREQEMRAFAMAQAQEAIKGSVEFYNNYVSNNPMAVGQTQVTPNDLSALVESKGDLKPTGMDEAMNSQWNSWMNDSTRADRLEKLQLTDQELRLLEFKAKSNPAIQGILDSYKQRKATAEAQSFNKPQVTPSMMMSRPMEGKE